jgi:hypothetical protein
VGDVDFGLVVGAFVGFAREVGEVFGARGVLEFFDVGVVDAETWGWSQSVAVPHVYAEGVPTELIELGLYGLYYFVLEDLAFTEQFLHGHVGDCESCR